VHRGSVLAAGFLIRWNTIGQNEARSRVLRLWKPGVQVKTIEQDYVVFLPAPMRIAAEQAVGEPLVRQGGSLSALPAQFEASSDPTPARQTASKTAPQIVPQLIPKPIPKLINDSLITAIAGRVVVTPLAELKDEDVAQWIDVGPAEVADVGSLGAAPVRPVFIAREFDSRRDIPGVPPASAELQSMLAAVQQEGASAKTGQVTPVSSFLYRSLSLLRSFAQRLLAKRSAPGRQSGASGHRLQAVPSNENSLWRRLQRASVQFLNFTRIPRLIANKYGRYLARMTEMIESGDLGEGLRHAIPLSNAGGVEQRMGRSLFLPHRRSNLLVNPYGRAPRSTVALGGSLFEYLRNLYRQAFERLAAQGRIEEATFVLTELLGNHAEAVSFLEKHGRLHLAAEIAEGRGLSPAMAIRLWWLAGDARRAIRLACRTGEFEQAVNLLASHPEEAKKLRLVWADRLALSGKYIAAAEAIRQIEQARHLAGAYLDQAIALGGTMGAIALGRRAARFSDSFADVAPRAAELMADETDESVRRRLAFTQSLLGEAITPETQALARLAARSLVRDIQQGADESVSTELRRLLKYAGDVCLRYDVPPVAAFKPASASDGGSRAIFHNVFPVALRSLPSELEPLIDLSDVDVGSRAILDVARLPDGKLLLALGESGMMLVSPEGRTLVHLRQPAQQFVVSDDGGKILGIARRDSVCRIVRFDALSRTASYWCDANISTWATEYDGAMWCVASGADMFLINTLGQGFEALWKIPEMEGRIVAIRRDRTQSRFYVVTENPKQLTCWQFDYPSCVLRGRLEFEADPGEHAGFLVAGQPPGRLMRNALILTEVGDILEQWTAYFPDKGIHTAVLHVKAGRQVVLRGHDLYRFDLAAVRSPWIAVPIQQADGLAVLLFNVISKTAEIRLRFQGSSEISLRFAGDLLFCSDEKGRIVALNVGTKKIVRDLRV